MRELKPRKLTLGFTNGDKRTEYTFNNIKYVLEVDNKLIISVYKSDIGIIQNVPEYLLCNIIMDNAINYLEWKFRDYFYDENKVDGVKDISIEGSTITITLSYNKFENVKGDRVTYLKKKHNLK